MAEAIEDEERLARLALELVVRRLALRATRNHPRAFEDLDREIEHLARGHAVDDKTALMHRVASLVGKAG